MQPQRPPAARCRGGFKGAAAPAVDDRKHSHECDGTPAQRIVPPHGVPGTQHRLLSDRCSGAKRCTSENIAGPAVAQDRKSTRLNSSHVRISYAVFCLKKKK